jgi:hypothetical protein
MPGYRPALAVPADRWAVALKFCEAIFNAPSVEHHGCIRGNTRHYEQGATDDSRGRAPIPRRAVLAQ